MMEEDAIPISALNEFAYCPRRCGLIHLEGEFEENVHTRRGEAGHERVDEEATRLGSDGIRVESALPVWSERLGLIGRCDVVEFSLSGVPYPVEYKQGSRRKWLNDDLQVAAQALCLEEMTGLEVPKGAIYHLSSRRRREVVMTETLRQTVCRVVGEIRQLFQSGQLPPVLNDARCRECAMKGVCQPAMMAAQEPLQRLRATLYALDGDG
ncbi:MAG: CRISPR-associated protein Cas4 [Magnetococcales bacterium]|nr:CRISPR-associated protein Cas4 [Magnetococcales bacterium]